MDIVSTSKDVAKLVKGFLTVEQQAKILQLQSEALDIQEEVLRLRVENRNLKSQIEGYEEAQDIALELEFREPYYFKHGDDSPYCPHCWDQNHKLVRVSKSLVAMRCPACRTAYGNFLC